MSSHPAIRPLPWDSEHFGVRIAAFQGEEVHTLELALEWCRTQGIECLYALAPSDDLELVRALERGRARLVDVRTTLDARVSPIARPASVRDRRASDVPELRTLAAASHTASRFYADGRFARERCDELYATWIEKSCAGWADLVLVADHAGEPAAYISCHVREGGRGEIGLVAVAPAAQGRGLGRDLVDGALAFFAERGLEHATVVTQARNVDAQRLYQARGFRTARVELWYHLWLDESAHVSMKSYRIPFNKPSFAGSEARYIAEAIERGHISGDGHFTKLCHALLQEALGVKKVLLTTNCTHALEMTGFLVDLQPGDEVIVPSFAFVTTALAYVLRGAKPVFCDVRPDTLNLDETKLERLITKRAKAIVPLHYAGVACEMDAILEISRRHGITVIEDNAHGLFAKYKGRNLGTLGALATQSFHETKNFTCGEGGALLVNDPRYIERAEILREKGTNRTRFLRGLVHKYTWVDLGSSYLPSDLLAAFLFAQLEARETIQKKRREIWERYAHELEPWARERGVLLPHVPEHCEQPYHMFYVLLRTSAQREALISHLEERGILAVFHYLPLHLSEMGRKFGGREGDCPVTEDLSSRLLRLPFFNRLTESEQDEVIEALKSFRG